jgi:hypothetical protein
MQTDIAQVLKEADAALKLSLARIILLESKLQFYANPQTWQRNSFKLATSIPEDTGDIGGFDPINRCNYLIGGKLARDYFNYGK